MKIKVSIKNIIVIIIVYIISLFFINTSFAAETGIINSETVNLREEPNADSKILKQFPNGKEVEIISKENEWYNVKIDGITGYLREDLITVETEEMVEEQPVVEETPIVQENTQTEEIDNNVEEENTTDDTNDITIGLQKVAKTTQLKSVPLIHGFDVQEVVENQEITVIEILSGWAYIDSNTSKGWMRTENLKMMETENVSEESQVVQEETSTEENVIDEESVQTTMYVNSQTINLRRETNVNSEIIAQLNINTEVTVISIEGDWSKVKVNTLEGYIASDLLSNEKQEVTTRSNYEPIVVENPIGNVEYTPVDSTLASSIVSTANSFLGYNYVSGGESPSAGFDCSGLTKYIYSQYGINLNRTAAQQYGNGVNIEKSELQPGDLVMFGSSQSSIYHVGIYIGGGNMIHAANPNRGVVIDTINSGYYYTNYYGATRVL